jgi:UDP-glucose 4-epimerase
MKRKTPVLVTGGAGYIGSHVALALLDAGWPVVVLDDLSTGFERLVPADSTFVRGDVGDRALVGRLLREHGIEAVIHLAGSIVVPESVVRPLRYYENNTAKSCALIEAAVEGGMAQFLFSSTAAVYGSPERVPVSETDPTVPINPYGHSKLMIETMLADAARAHGFDYCALRYFNVAGADPRGRSGQLTAAATHLIKIAAEAAVGRRPHVEIYGEDYPTADGTAVRDYIHVVDLAAAHVRALEKLVAVPGESRILNCGYGRGYSVREVLDAVDRAAGRHVARRPGPRRAGDSAVLVADNRRILAELDWIARFDDLDLIVADALAWERRQLGPPPARDPAARAPLALNG